MQHLQASLARLDVAIQRAVRHWQLAGQDSSDPFRGLRISEAEASALADRPLASNWGQAVALSTAEVAAFDQAARAANNAVHLIEQAARQQQVVLRLQQLATTFQFDAFDLDAFLICLAPALDLRYERLYAYLQDDVTRKLVSLNLILDLLTEPGLVRLRQLTHFMADAPLIKYQLLQPGEALSPSGLAQTWVVDSGIVAWLLGNYVPHFSLGTQAYLEAPLHDLIDELLAGHVRADLERAATEKAIVVLYGPDRSNQLSAAKLLAQSQQRPLLVVHLASVINETTTPLQAVRLGLRDARLTGSIPCLLDWDTCLVDNAPPASLLSELCNYPDVVLVLGQRAWQARDTARTRSLMWLEFPIPDYAQRCALWKQGIQDYPADPIDFSALAGQFLLTASQIRDAVASAHDKALQRGSAITEQDLLAAARAHSSPGLSGLARKITPRYVWNDIVLPPEQLAILREIVATVHGRHIVLNEWGVGQKLVPSDGITILFAGQPGTGKTMAAEVIAAELGLDLYKIDLSTIVSKYIGETEKNLEKIFSEAQSSNAILFFDEADAIFGKRSEVKDAHDRYANIEISYLLQRMEAYDGVTILATNLRANLDDAFTRRLQFALDFPFPDEEYRRRIWQTLFPPDVPRSVDLDFDLLARRFKLAGGNIRNIIVSAAYLAAADGGCVTMTHILHGARREMQKMGRLVNEKDLAL
ncbi:ATP-dependent zinc metalloprotease FtsH [Thermoflexales bacterium]|nr:ATP-dependent zinc metalloprotease FtsH [Thermoflexales bacterium]